MDVQRLKEIIGEVDIKLPTHFDIGGHKVCEEIRKLKVHFKEALDIIVKDGEATSRWREGR